MVLFLILSDADNIKGYYCSVSVITKLYLTFFSQVPKNNAVVITLFFLKVKKLELLQMKLLRQTLKQLKLSVKKSASKIEICEILGKQLF